MAGSPPLLYVVQFVCSATVAVLHPLRFIIGALHSQVLGFMIVKDGIGIVPRFLITISSDYLIY